MMGDENTQSAYLFAVFFQGWLRVTARIHGIHDQSGDRERPVELGGGAGIPSSHVGRKTLHLCSGTLRSK